MESSESCDDASASSSRSLFAHIPLRSLPLSLPRTLLTGRTQTEGKSAHVHSQSHVCPPIGGQGEGEGGDSNRLSLQNTVPLAKAIFDPPPPIRVERKFSTAPPP